LPLIIGAIVGIYIWLGALKWADDRLATGLNDKLTTFVSGAQTKMFARDGKTLLYAASDERRDPVEQFSDIPQNVINATLAAEDRRFFEHNGVDYISVARSVVTDVREHRSAQGGSTITMQLVKRLFTSPDKTLIRKLHDAALAVELEKHLTKQQILQDYLNQVYYGEGAYGIKAASEVYFGKTDLNKLTVGEAALLARLVRRPTYENPFKDLKKATDNRNDVLETEREMGWITTEEYSKAIDERVHLVTDKQFGSGEYIYRAPYFVRYVLDALKKDMPDIDLKAGGYTIETTLDPAMEKVAERELKHYIDSYRHWRINTGAFVLMNADGQVLAMVGGVGDYHTHQFNAVVQGRRQPGSSFKPIVYSTALSTGAISPNDTISSAAYRYEDSSGNVWEPHNDNGFGGNVSITQAIAGSINTAAARVCEKVGPDQVVSYAHDVFGYTSKLDPVMSIALGSQAVSPLEQAQAYSIFMLHGDRATPYGVTRVIGPNSEVVKAYGPDIHRNMLDSNVAAQMDIYLRAVVTGGTARRALPVANARGKTGTTQDNVDAWFCGYTNNFVAVCWVSNQQYDKHHNPPFYYEPMSRASFGGIVPTYIWTAIMQAAREKYGEGAPPPPAEKIEVDTSANSDDSGEKPIKIDSKDDSSDSSSDSNDNSDDTSATTTDTPPDTHDQKAPETDQEPVQKPPAPKPTPPPDQSAKTTQDTVGEERPRRTTRATSETVTVEICADTGLRATVYCPETVSRTFVKGTEPKRYCTKHHQ
jgi:penicillin-binding protein 1A